MTPCSGQLTRGASASRNARIRPRSRVRHRRRPAPWSYPEQRFPQRPHRRLVALRGRTDTTTACSASSNSTPSTTTFTNPSSPAHSLAERTPFPAYGSCCLKAGIEGEGNGVRSARLWAGLLGLVKVVVEGVEFDEAEQAVVVSVRPRKATKCQVPGLMETIKPGGTSMVAPRKYPEELRERSIRMTLDARQDPASRPSACRRIGEQLGINPETLRAWVIQAEVDAGARPGTTSAEADRLGELEREVRELRRANAILLSASVFVTRSVRWSLIIAWFAMPWR